ncbi:uncharacterized protein LOC143346886 [Colletes latitarsis]|uniref:uncharacterized protein LOC143346886 n=1 Tax=Colletes latitarsis TaxID=2605962 RepID=UPI0040360805
MHLILLWALVALIGRVHGKCSIAPFVDDERSIAYACTHGDLNDLDEISSEAEWIEFTVSRFHIIPDNAFLRFKNLRRLSFYNCHVNFTSPNAFAGLTRLEWLIFHGTKIYVVRNPWFRHLPSLRKLILDRCGLMHIEPDVFRALPRLETLSLRDNDLDCLPIEELSYLRELRVMRIGGNPWLCNCWERLDRYILDHSLVPELECPKEMYLCRKYQCMTQVGFPIHSSNNCNWEYARIHGNAFQTNVFTSLDRLPDKTIRIEISGLTIDTLPRYGFFRFGNSLQSLELNNCRINRIESGAFAGLHKLQYLSLFGNQFPVVGADWFRDLVNLQQLILRNNSIEQIERTALWHLGSSLRYLDIQDNRLRCIAVEELAELKKLKRLDAIGNPWICACRKNLQTFLTQKNIGFEINAGRCYENENDIRNDANRWRLENVHPSVTTGRVHWAPFEDCIKQSNITITRPVPSVPPTELPVVTSQPPVYAGSCYREKTKEQSRPIYTCRGITSIEELNLIPPTAHTIRVILSNIKKIPQGTFARFNGYLSKLELRDCGIETIEPRAFSKLYNLEYLSLKNNQLNIVNGETVQGLSNLRHLDLSHNSIYIITNDAFDDIPYLTSLDVSENSMNCIGIEYMANRLRYLSTLHVANNPWSCLCGTKLADFLDTNRIHYDKHTLLLKEDCYATQYPTTITIPPATTPSVPTWNETIEGTCTICDDTAEIRYQCTGGNLLLLQSLPPEVTAIEFNEGHLPRLPAGRLSKFTNLRELVIRNSGLITVEHGTFDGLNKLKNLTIQDNPLEMIGSSWFALENLEKLDLRGNSINYIAPGAFRNLNRLTYLNLEGNDLKCIFTSDLNDMPNIYIVEFSGNPLKWRCRVELEQFLEARKIRFVRIENSCEGKKLMRNLLLQNKTDGSFDCPSKCSAASHIRRHVFPSVFALLLLIISIY